MDQLFALLVFMLNQRVEGPGQDTDFVTGIMLEEPVFSLLERDIPDMGGKIHQGAGVSLHYQSDRKNDQHCPDDNQRQEIFLGAQNRFIGLNQGIVGPNDPVVRLKMFERGQ